MNLTQLDKRWIAIQVSAGREFATAVSIRYRGYQEFVPSYNKQHRRLRCTKEAALFPGYVFVRFDAQNTNSILTTPGVVRFVGMGACPTPIEDSEIEALQIATRSGMKCGPCAFVEIGQHMEIRHGPFSGLKGQLVRWKNEERLVLSVSLLRQSVLVELESCDAAPLQPHRYLVA